MRNVTLKARNVESTRVALEARGKNIGLTISVVVAVQMQKLQNLTVALTKSVAVMWAVEPAGGVGAALSQVASAATCRLSIATS